MDIFIVALDGLEVELTSSAAAAVDRARKLAADEPPVAVEVLRLDDNSLELIAGFPAAAAATA